MVTLFPSPAGEGLSLILSWGHNGHHCYQSSPIRSFWPFHSFACLLLRLSWRTWTLRFLWVRSWQGFCWDPVLLRGLPSAVLFESNWTTDPQPCLDPLDQENRKIKRWIENQKWLLPPHTTHSQQVGWERCYVGCFMGETLNPDI